MMFRKCLLGVVTGLVAVTGWALEWNSTTGFKDWGVPFHLQKTADQEMLSLDIQGGDSQLAKLGLNLDPARLERIEIEYRATGLPAVTGGEIYFAFEGQKGFTGRQYWYLPSLKSDGNWHVLTVKNPADLLEKLPAYQPGKKVTMLRLDLVNQFPGKIDVKRITLVEKPEPACAWSEANQFYGWGQPARMTVVQKTPTLKMNITGKDSYLSNKEVAVDLAVHKQLVIEYRATGLPYPTFGQVYFLFEGQKNFTDAQRWDVPSLKSDGQWHEIKIATLSAKAINGMKANPGKKINHLRLDLTDQFPGTIEVRSITFKAL